MIHWPYVGEHQVSVEYCEGQNLVSIYMYVVVYSLTYVAISMQDCDLEYRFMEYCSEYEWYHIEIPHSQVSHEVCMNKTRDQDGFSHGRRAQLREISRFASI